MPVGRASGQPSMLDRSVVRLTERDFKISAPKEVAAGDVVLRVKNRGSDAHELLVVREGRGRVATPWGRDDRERGGGRRIRGRRSRAGPAGQRPRAPRPPHTGPLHPPLQHVGATTSPACTRRSRCADGAGGPNVPAVRDARAGRDRITISEAVADPPDLTVVQEEPGPGTRKRSRKPRSQPAIHDAASDEEPHASGLEIR
jgi:hypothetical protein